MKGNRHRRKEKTPGHKQTQRIRKPKTKIERLKDMGADSHGTRGTDRLLFLWCGFTCLFRVLFSLVSVHFCRFPHVWSYWGSWGNETCELKAFRSLHSHSFPNQKQDFCTSHGVQKICTSRDDIEHSRTMNKARIIIHFPHARRSSL